MKLSSRKLNRGSIELAMTSMIDVIFLLIIFFITTLSYHKVEKNLESGIQVLGRSADRRRADLEPALVEVVPKDGGFAFKLGARELASLDELKDLLARFPNKSDGAFIKVRDDAPFDLVAQAMQACHDAGFSTVSYLPFPGKK